MYSEINKSLMDDFYQSKTYTQQSELFEKQVIEGVYAPATAAKKLLDYIGKAVISFKADNF